MAGVVGMLGAGGMALAQWGPIKRIFHKRHLFRIGYATIGLFIVTMLIIGLGVRTSVRALDYSSQYKLALSDYANSKDNISALDDIAEEMIKEKHYSLAVYYAKKSIKIYPLVTNYNNLGVAEEMLGKYAAAFNAYTNALHYGSLNLVYENLSEIYLVYKRPAQTKQFLEKAVAAYPNDYKIWLYIALFEQATGDHKQASSAIEKAAGLGPVPNGLVAPIMSGQSFILNILGKTLLI